MKIIYLSLLSAVVLAQAGYFYYDCQAKRHESELNGSFRQQTVAALNELETKTDSSLAETRAEIDALKEFCPILVRKAFQSGISPVEQRLTQTEERLTQAEKTIAQTNDVINAVNGLQKDSLAKLQETETQLLLLKKEQIANVKLPPRRPVNRERSGSLMDE